MTKPFNIEYSPLNHKYFGILRFFYMLNGLVLRTKNVFCKIGFTLISRVFWIGLFLIFWPTEQIDMQILGILNNEIYIFDLIHFTPGLF